MTERTVQEVESLYRRHLYDRAVETGLAALESGGGSLHARTQAELHTWIGLSALELAHTDLAASSLGVAHTWDPLDKQVGVALGRLLLRSERDAEAWEVLEGVLLHHAEDMKPSALAALTIPLVESYLRAGEGHAALRRVRAALRSARDDARLLELEADALDQLQRVDEANAVRRERLDRTTDPETRAAAARGLCRALMDSGRAIEAAEVAHAAAAELERLLDARPRALKAWEALHGILADARRWHASYDAHLRMAARLSDADDDLRDVLSLIWRSAGDVARQRLGDDDAAAAAYARADALRGQADDDAVMRPTGMHVEVSPIDELWNQVLQRPTDFAAVARYGEALVQAGDQQYGSHVLDAVAAARGGGLHAAWTPGRFARPLTDDLRNRFVRPRTRRAALDALLHIAFHVVGHLFAHAPRDHGLHARDELPPNTALPSVRLLLEVSADLGFTHPPRLFAGRRAQGLTSACMLEPAFILGADVLAAEDSPTLRFQAAQLLTMAQPRFFLAGLLSTNQLLGVVKAITEIELPGAERTDAAFVARVREAGRAAMTEAWEAPLQDVIRRLKGGAAAPRLHEWSALASAEAARTGLIVAGDIEASLAAAARWGVLREPERLDARRTDLWLFALSPDYYRLRETLTAETLEATD